MATSEAGTRESAETEDDDEESPDVDEDLIREELRIDGICGVY